MIFSQVDQITVRSRPRNENVANISVFSDRSPGSGSLQLGGVDGGDGGAAPRLVGDPVQRIFSRVPAVASQTEKDKN